MERQPVSSSNIKSIGYMEPILEIEFHSGGVYQYSKVVPEVYRSFLESESLGKYFAQYIKGTYTCEKIENVEAVGTIDQFQKNMASGIGVIDLNTLKEWAKGWIKIYSQKDGRNECCRETVVAFLTYAFDLK